MLKNKKNKGFTLIELLVVIAIIGILASIVLVSLGGAREKARDARRQSDIRQISLAMEMYYDDYQAYATSATMVATIGSYLDPVPGDPQGGAYKWISNISDDQKYCVCTIIEATTTVNEWFCASHKGTRSTTSLVLPTALTDCW